MMARDNLYAELMEDLHPNRPRVEILGDSRVIVENHCGIQEYDRTASCASSAAGARCVFWVRIWS